MTSHILGLVGLSIVILWSLLAFQTGVEINSFPHMLGGAMFFIPSTMVAVLIIYNFVEQNVNQWRKKKQERLSLKTFFKWWLEQAEAEHPPMFITRLGLCYALEMWLSNRSTTPAQRETLTEELRQKIREYSRVNKLNYIYPFGGKQEFFHELQHQSAHKNPMRIAWVKEQLQKD